MLPATSLAAPPHPPTQRAIVDTFWGCNPQENTLGAYWRFYTQECDQALHDRGAHILSRTHEDIIEIVTALKADQSRDDIRTLLRPKFRTHHDNEDELMDNSINLSAQLLLMIDVGCAAHSYSGRRHLSWMTGSLRECVAAHFSCPRNLEHKGVKLQWTFNSMNLGRVAGVQIVATNCLLDHLRLTHDDKTLHVFHHASFLKCQSSGSMLPDGLANETLRTLSLLFPQSDPVFIKWCRRLPLASPLDTQLTRLGYLKTDDRQIEKSTFWHDRLVVLKQVFDEATPKTLSQWWFDRRNGVQWYTFWVAVVVLGLTLFFGLIQSLEGALQVYGTFRGGAHD